MMSRKRKMSEIDAEKIRKQATDLGQLVGSQAKDAGEKATVLAGQGVSWAQDVALPAIDKAWRDGVKAAAPRVEAVADKARPAVDHARDKIVEDYIPRLQKAMQEAADAASGDGSVTQKATKAGKAAKKAAMAKPKKKRGKALGWILVGTVAAGTGYLLWRRSQPVDDPWAEEYWDDAALPVPSTAPTTTGAGTETAQKASEAVDSAADAAGKAAAGVKDVAESAAKGAAAAGEKVAGAAGDAAEGAKKATSAAADQAESAASKAKDAADKAADAASTAADSSTNAESDKKK